VNFFETQCRSGPILSAPQLNYSQSPVYTGVEVKFNKKSTSTQSGIRQNEYLAVT